MFKINKLNGYKKKMYFKFLWSQIKNIYKCSDPCWNACPFKTFKIYFFINLKGSDSPLYDHIYTSKHVYLISLKGQGNWLSTCGHEKYYTNRGEQTNRIGGLTKSKATWPMSKHLHTHLTWDIGHGHLFSSQLPFEQQFHFSLFIYMGMWVPLRLEAQMSRGYWQRGVEQPEE